MRYVIRKFQHSAWENVILPKSQRTYEYFNDADESLTLFLKKNEAVDPYQIVEGDRVCKAVIPDGALVLGIMEAGGRCSLGLDGILSDAAYADLTENKDGDLFSCLLHASWPSKSTALKAQALVEAALVKRGYRSN